MASRVLSFARRAQIFTQPRTIPCRFYASGNEGRKGPLTGAEKKEHPNAGRKGPLTGSKKKSKSSQPEDSSSDKPKKQSDNANVSESTQGAESAAAPKTAPGQGVEDQGGHAMPSGPGSDGKFAEQNNSALDVAGAVDKSGTSEADGRGDKVDSKFWSDKKND